jgi:glycosyltransferase involved in cell wall biosynthesis
MKIGIYFDSSQSQGGIYHHNINLIDIFKDYLPSNFDITYITHRDDLVKIFQEKNCKCLKLKNNIILKLEKFLFKFSFSREIYSKLSIKNSFEKIIKKNEFDLIFFNSPHELITLLNDTNCIIYLLSMQHKTLNFFPEYSGSHHNLNLRDHIINKASNFAFKILVGAHKDKLLLNKFYNTDIDKIIVQPYTFTLPYIYEDNKDYDYQKTFENLKIPNKKIFLYPAQFWAHKNHKYLIDVAKDFKKNDISDVVFVFCGFDKGNLDYVKKQIIKNDVQEYFKIFNYLSDFELISLYLKCFSILMPSYVGHTVIPMYEAFYFKKNIFFTKGLADDNLIEFLIEIDISDVQSVRKKYIEIQNNDKKNNDKLNKAKEFFNNSLSKDKMAETFINIFNEYKFIQERWKE